MGGPSKIQWTERTWNPIVGCSVLTPGCTHCYAMKMAARLEVMGNVSHYAGTTKKIKGNAVWTGKLALAPNNILLEPLRRKKPTTYFVNSMGDLGHEDVPPEWFAHCMVIMAMAQQHTFQLLTKRSEHLKERLLEYSESTIEDLASDFGYGRMDVTDKWPLPNLWIGASTERQQEADERIPHLLQTPAAVRFISAEPLLGPIDLTHIDIGFCGTAPTDRIHRNSLSPEANRLDWVIVGGESGPNARPMHPDWARSLRDQCKAAGVAYFFKQWGQWKDGSDFASDKSVKAVMDDGRVRDTDLASLTEHDRLYSITVRNPTLMRNVGKKKAGRLLDGREHNDLPNLAAKPLPGSTDQASLSQSVGSI